MLYILYLVVCTISYILFCILLHYCEQYSKKIVFRYSLSSLVEVACDLFLTAKYSDNVIISQSYLVCIYLCVYICIYVSTVHKAK